MAKKIAIVTLPLLNNYGGILQAFAMSKFCKNLGYETNFINLQNFTKSENFKIEIKYFIKKYLLFFVKKYKNPTKYHQNQNSKNFIENFIHKKTKKIFSSEEFRNFIKNSDFDCLILGSDQVLYPPYCGKFKQDFMFDFTGKKHIIYAGSFGRDFLCDEYLKNFDFYKRNFAKFFAISTREKSGVEIFNKNFGLDANFVLDPTLMIDKNEYIKLFKNIKNSNSNGKIFAYILDENEKNLKNLQNFATKKGLKIILETDANATKFKNISIQQWLKNIHDCEIVVTDSFHGCVFSIIFKKPFFCFVNENRGASRFDSLFEMLDLQDRIIKDGNFTNQNINYEKVYEKLEKIREISKEFLVKNI